MEKERIRLLAIQMESAVGEIKLNIDTVENLLRANIEKYEGADFVFLPEVWTCGWCPRVFHAGAETIEKSLAVKMLQRVAVEYGVNIFGGSFIRSNGEKYYNTCPIIGRNGNIIGLYDKNHLFSYYGDDENKFIEAGIQPVIVDIEGIKAGVTICYDIRFPEIYRAYRKAGADILVNMAAWPKSRKIHWDTLTRNC